MKANSRRRVLISSVAMLLVAIVALGTSTYAWFTNATTAKANNLTVTANAAKGLQISTDGSKWGTNQTWAAPANATISPLSVPFTLGNELPESYFAKQAGVEGPWTTDNAAKSTYEFGTLTFKDPSAYVNSEGYYISYMVDTKVVGDKKGDDDKYPTYDLFAEVNVKSEDDADLDDVIRIAITDSTGKVYGVYGDEQMKPIASISPNVATTTNNAETQTTRISCGKVSGDVSTLFIYVWIEGQDQHCVDALMSLSGNYNISFSAPDINK